MTTNTRKDIYQSVTDQVVAAIEEGTGSFKMPWRNSGGFPSSPINAVSKKTYRGINVLLLWAAAERRGYTSGLWATFKQWQALGGQVRKGEKSTPAVFWKFFEKSDDNGEVEPGDALPEKRIPFVREYALFNVAQVDGYEMVREPKASKAERIERAEEFFAALGAERKDGGNQAYYSPTSDSIFMPPMTAFKESLFYYSVLSHETTHWTGAPHRLNRDMVGRFGSDRYAMEELVAELGAAFLCASLNLPTDPRRDHAPYISTWLKVLKADKKAIFTVAVKAQEAVDWMLDATGSRLAISNSANSGSGDGTLSSACASLELGS